MDIDKERLLVSKAKKGNLKAFEELVISYEKMVYNIIYRIMNNSEDTYDLSQETFIKAYKNINKFNEKSKFSTWLYRIATNASLDELRKRKGKDTYSINKHIEYGASTIVPEYEDISKNIEEEIINKEKANVIELAFRQLSDDSRIILSLREMQGMSYSEISDILEIPLGTVKSRISRARQEMKDILMQDKEPYVSYFRHSNIRRDNNEL